MKGPGKFICLRDKVGMTYTQVNFSQVANVLMPMLLTIAFLSLLKKDPLFLSGPSCNTHRKSLLIQLHCSSSVDKMHRSNCMRMMGSLTIMRKAYPPR